MLSITLVIVLSSTLEIVDKAFLDGKEKKITREILGLEPRTAVGQAAFEP